MRDKFVNNKGITLIALIITIIVLLILAGVTISMVLGTDGIIAKAMASREATEVSNEMARIRIAYASVLTDRYRDEEEGRPVRATEVQERLRQDLNSDEVIVEEEQISDERIALTITMPSGRKYTIDGTSVLQVEELDNEEG